VGDVIVHGEDVFQLVLVGEDVDHPGEDDGVECAAFRLAGFGGADGAEHAELWVLAEVLLNAIGRGAAEVNVFVPAYDAERDTVVQLIFGRLRAVGEHDAFEAIALGGRLTVEQRGRFGRIEVMRGGEDVGLIVEVELGLVDLRVRDDESVGQRVAVVFVALDGCFDLGHEGLDLLLVAGLDGSQRRDVHVTGHGCHAGAHVSHVAGAGFATHVHTGHTALGLVRRLLRVRWGCGQREDCGGERKRPYPARSSVARSAHGLWAREKHHTGI